MAQTRRNLAAVLHLTVSRVFFACGVGLIYSGLMRFGLVPGIANTVAHVWYVLAGTVLIAASLLKLLGKEQGVAMKVMSWAFLGVSALMWVLLITLQLKA